MSVSVPGNSCIPCRQPTNTICPVKLTGICVFYGGSPISGINTGDTLDVIVNKLSSLIVGKGTVTSVGLSAPSIFTVGGTPVTTSGILALTLNTQSANTVFAGPTTGAASIPSFRPLVIADIPPPTNGLSVVSGGIGLGGTLTQAITRILTGGNTFQFRDSVADPGHNLQHTFSQQGYIIAGDSTNNFGSKIELQDTASNIFALRIFNNVSTSGSLGVGMQTINHNTNNPLIQFMATGNTIISSDSGFSDDGTPIQIKGVTSHNSNVGIGVGSGITAKLHIAAGSIVAGTAPIKLSAGPVMTTPENGTLEFDGTHLYFTIGSTRNTLI